MKGDVPIEKFSFSCCREPDFMEKFNALGVIRSCSRELKPTFVCFKTGYEL